MKRGLISWMLAALSLATSLGAQEAGEPAERAAFGSALARYRAGDYEQAWKAFSELVERGGEAAAPQARLNGALAALRLLRSGDAEALVAPLTGRDGWRADAAFVLGMAARQHGERAVVAAELPDAEPMAWVMATKAMQRSELQLREAVRLRPDWPAAVRNLERAIRRRAEVEAARDAAAPKESKKEDAPEPEPPIEPPASEQPPEVVIPEVATAELSARELEQLQERVRQQQRQKVRGRQQRSRARAGAGRRDW